MGRKNIIIQHPCYFTRLGMEKILEKHLPNNLSRVFNHLGHLDEYYRHLRKRHRVDIAVINLLSGNHLQRELLNWVVRQLRLNNPDCQIIFIMDTKNSILLVNHMHELQHIQVVLEPKESLSTITDRLSLIFSDQPQDRPTPGLKMPRLSQRELSVLRYLLKGKSITRIALRLGLNYKTVSHHKRSALVKLGVNSLQPLLLNEHDCNLVGQWLNMNTRHTLSVSYKSSGV
ncbi:DNA-binding transcriptional activator BglJ [Serratia fonticola]|uniref:DNA-binding transcriptional activator BglJ n=1 Tax=Serratia fonticola TaxID=47917 RepID=A0A448S2V2_SERFO|nr:DNA-binding transcriptional activator BglJ [Serratia fonticola]